MFDREAGTAAQGIHAGPPASPDAMPEPAASAAGQRRVVIVGGGISGLTLACGLAKLGVPAILLDENAVAEGQAGASRGIVYSQKTLEIFQRLGIYERIAAQGVRWTVGRTFSGEQELYAVDMRQQAGSNLSGQPPVINIPQSCVEAFLVDRIQALGHVELRWGHRVTAFRQDESGATLSVSTPAGDELLAADYVVDASGRHSPIREWAGATLTATQGEDRWSIVDVRLSGHPPLERRTWIEAPFNENRAVWLHQLADALWRIDYEVAPDADPAEASRQEAVRERLLLQFGPDTQAEIVWAGPYTCRAGCVDRMRLGRLFFLGDSAKVASPFGGRGGNSGVADADNLAWKLAAVLRGRAPATLLDSYHQERHQAARQQLLVNRRTARFLRPASAAERRFRTAAIDLARRYPFARQFINTGRVSAAIAYTRSAICAPGGGQSVQNVSFHWPDGSTGCLNDLLEWAAGDLLLLVFGEVPPPARERLRALTSTAPVRAVQVLGEGRAQAREHVLDPQGHLQGACHVFGHAWALVRPDAYVAASGESIDAALVNAVGAAWALDTGAHE